MQSVVAKPSGQRADKPPNIKGGPHALGHRCSPRDVQAALAARGRNRVSAPATRSAAAPRQTSRSSEPGSALLGPDVPLLRALAQLPADREARDGAALARARLARLLALEVKSTHGGQKAHRAGGASAHRPHGQRKSAVGADANHGGTIEAGLPRLASDGAEVYAKALERPALAGMEGVFE